MRDFLLGFYENSTEVDLLGVEGQIGEEQSANQIHCLFMGMFIMDEAQLAFPVT